MTTYTRSRLCLAWGISVAAVVATIAPGSAHALPTTYNPYFGQATAAGDFDNDGNQEFVIGDPSEAVDGNIYAGVVYVYNSLPSGTLSRTTYSLTSTGIPGSPAQNDRFGHALAVGDFDYDGYDDLAIGMPGKRVAEDQGAVIVLHGSQNGLSRTRIAQLTPPSAPTGQPDYWGFGYSLAAGQFNADYVSDLVVGFPGRAIDYEWFAGSIYVYYGESYEVIDSSFRQRWTHQSLVNEAPDGQTFGFSLAVGDFDRDYLDDLAIGVPCATVSGKSCAGAIHVVYGATNSLLPGGAQYITQNTSDVHGAAEEDDQFGLSLTAGRFDSGNYSDLAVGVPHEGLDGVEQAGMVNVLYGGTNGVGIGASENTSFGQGGGAGDYSSEGDRYGFALANGDFDDNGYDDLVVGAYRDYILGTYGSFMVYYSGSGGVSHSNYQFWHSKSPGLTSPRPRIGGDAFSVGDFDDDGVLDLASSTMKGGGEVEILEGRAGAKLTTDGGFSFP